MLKNILSVINEAAWRPSATSLTPEVALNNSIDMIITAFTFGAAAYVLIHHRRHAEKVALINEIKMRREVLCREYYDLLESQNSEIVDMLSGFLSQTSSQATTSNSGSSGFFYTPSPHAATLIEYLNRESKEIEEHDKCEEIEAIIEATRNEHQEFIQSLHVFLAEAEANSREVKLQQQQAQLDDLETSFNRR